MLKKEKFRILVCSGNLGNEYPDTQSLKAWIPTDGNIVEVIFGSSNYQIHGKKPQLGKFDLIAIGMQEYVQNRKDSEYSSAKGSYLNLPSKTTQKLKGSLERVTNYVSRQKELMDRIDELDRLIDAQCPSYVQIVDVALGETRLIILVKQYLKHYITNVECNSRATGVGNVLANKGGVIATLYLKSTRLTFISAHLAAHEGETYYNERCSNVTDILAKTATMREFNGFDAALTSHHCFLFGDLNYRLVHQNNSDNELSKNYSLEEAPHAENLPEELHTSKTSQDAASAREDILNLVKQEAWQELSKWDGLTKAIEEQECLYNFRNPLCMFPPTFKVRRCPGITYNPQRTPSYTDRILWTSADALERDVKLLKYECCSQFASSDHKPIRSAFLLSTHSVARRRSALSRTLSFRQNIFRKHTYVGISQIQCNVNTNYSYLSNLYVKVDALPSNLVDVNKLLKLKKYSKKSPQPDWRSDNGKELAFRLVNSATDDLIGSLLLITIIGDNGSSLANELGKAKKVIGTVVVNLHELYTSMCGNQRDQYYHYHCSDERNKVKKRKDGELYVISKSLVKYGKARGNISFSLALWKKERSVRNAVFDKKFKIKKNRLRFFMNTAIMA